MISMFLDVSFWRVLMYFISGYELNMSNNLFAFLLLFKECRPHVLQFHSISLEFIQKM